MAYSGGEGSLNDEEMGSEGTGIEEVVRLRKAFGSIESEGFSDLPVRGMAIRAETGSEKLQREESKRVSKAASWIDSDAQQPGRLRMEAMVRGLCTLLLQQKQKQK